MTDDQPPSSAREQSTAPYGVPGQPAPRTQPAYPTTAQPSPYLANAGWAQQAGTVQSYQPQPAAPTTDQNVETWHLAIAWVCAVVTFGYLLPWAIAATRGKSNAGPIGLVNFFAGWTIVGWIAALVMACGAHQQRFVPMNILMAQGFPQGQQYPQPQYQPSQQPAVPPANWYPAPDGAGQAYWDGRQWTGHRS